jgi:Helix-turn-helix domain
MSAARRRAHLTVVDTPPADDLAAVRSELLSVADVGKIIGLRSRSAVHDFIRRSDMRVVRGVTHGVRVPRSELERYLANNLIEGRLA